MAAFWSAVNDGRFFLESPGATLYAAGQRVRFRLGPYKMIELRHAAIMCLSPLRAEGGPAPDRCYELMRAVDQVPPPVLPWCRGASCMMTCPYRHSFSPGQRNWNSTRRLGLMTPIQWWEPLRIGGRSVVRMSRALLSNGRIGSIHAIVGSKNIGTGTTARSDCRRRVPIKASPGTVVAPNISTGGFPVPVAILAA